MINPLRNKRDDWIINTVPFKGGHYAGYPPKLVETLSLIHIYIFWGGVGTGKSYLAGCIANALDVYKSQSPAGTFSMKLGKTTYVVGVHFSQTAKDTLEDKMKRDVYKRQGNASKAI